MKKINRVDTSQFKKITELRILDTNGDYFIVGSGREKNIIDKDGNILLERNYDQIFFATPDIISCSGLNGQYFINLKNGKKIEGNLYKRKYGWVYFHYNVGNSYFDNNLNIIELDSNFSNSIRNFLAGASRNYLYLIDNDRVLIEKNRKYLVVNRFNKKVLCVLKGKSVGISESGLLFIRKFNHDKFCGFVNCNSEIIDIEFEYHADINENLIIIKNEGLYSIIDEKGNFKMQNKHRIKYNKNLKLITVYDNEDSFYVLDENLNRIFSANIVGLNSIIGPNAFIIKTFNDNKLKLVNREKKVLYSYTNEKDNIIKSKGNLITISKDNQTMLMDTNGDIIIPFVSSDILLMGNNRILVDNCIIDLNDEYVNLKINYELEIECFGRTINKEFKSNDVRDKFISEVEAINRKYNEDINTLVDKPEYNTDKPKKRVKRLIGVSYEF